MRYKITFELESAISFTHKPIFDGILFGAYVRWVLLTQEGRNYYLDHMASASLAHQAWIRTQPIHMVFPQKLTIPAEELMVYDGLPIVQKEGVLQSSIMVYEAGPDDTIRFRKRYRQKLSELAGFGKKKRKTRINNGATKSYDLPFGVKACKYVSFIFETDDLPMVKFLLTFVKGINKKRNRGVGLIKNYVIEPTDLPIVRPRPAQKEGFQLEEGLRLVRTAWKPPYFDSRNIALCQIN